MLAELVRRAERVDVVAVVVKRIRTGVAAEHGPYLGPPAADLGKAARATARGTLGRS